MPEGLLRTADGFRAGYRDTVGAITEMAETMEPDAWDLPTGCPGWSVRDLVAHISALESLLIGRDLPAHEVAEDLPHVRSQFGRFMEIGVDYRRGWPVSKLLDEFRDVLRIRLDTLDAVEDSQLDDEARGIFGTSKLRGVLTIRIFDIWSHEQDMRRALRRPGGFEGPAGIHSRERMARGIGDTVARDVQPPEGSTLLLDITGPGAAQRSISFADGKGRVSESAPAPPEVTMRLDMNTLTVLACGRSDDPAARERVELEGDVSLGQRILEHIGFTP